MSDVRGYYSVLGVKSSATDGEIRSAYRKMAKELHPDSPHVTDKGARFRQLNEAYRVIANPATRAAYDRECEAKSDESRDDEASATPVSLVTCDVCGKIAVQARQLVFWRVRSFLFVTRKLRIEKIFCRACASKEQFESTLCTAALGWWAIPWGPVWATSNGITNALGGTRNQKRDEQLLWQNGLAFAARGQAPLAVGIANQLRKSDNTEIAKSAANIIRFFDGKGDDIKVTLKNVWPRFSLKTLGLLAMVFTVPTCILAAISYVMWVRDRPAATIPPDQLAAVFGRDAATTSSVDTTAVDASTLASEAHQPVDAGSLPPGSQPAIDATGLPSGSQQNDPAAVSSCSVQPPNGSILQDDRPSTRKGHFLGITNGTEGPAIVKARNAQTGRRIVTFLIGAGEYAEVYGLADGSYTFQYAVGTALASDCRSLLGARAQAFPGPEVLQTQTETSDLGTRTVRSKLTYTLYKVPNGNVRPIPIDNSDFDAP